MAIFCFKSDETGVVLERVFPIGRAPQSIVDDSGTRYRRDFASERKQIDASVAETCRGFPKVSKALPQGAGEGISGISHNDKGEVVVHNRRAEREILKQTGYTRG